MSNNSINIKTKNEVEIMEQIEDYFKTNIAGYSFQQWNKVCWCNNARNFLIRENKAADIETISKMEKLPCIVVKDILRLCGVVETYNNMLDDAENVLKKDLSLRKIPLNSLAHFPTWNHENNRNTRETKLLGGMFCDEYRLAYDQESKAKQKEEKWPPETLSTFQWLRKMLEENNWKTTFLKYPADDRVTMDISAIPILDNPASVMDYYFDVSFSADDIGTFHPDIKIGTFHPKTILGKRSFTLRALAEDLNRFNRQNTIGKLVNIKKIELQMKNLFNELIIDKPKTATKEEWLLAAIFGNPFEATISLRHPDDERFHMEITADYRGVIKANSENYKGWNDRPLVQAPLNQFSAKAFCEGKEFPLILDRGNLEDIAREFIDMPEREMYIQKKQMELRDFYDSEIGGHTAAQWDLMHQFEKECGAQWKKIHPRKQYPHNDKNFITPLLPEIAEQLQVPSSVAEDVFKMKQAVDKFQQEVDNYSLNGNLYGDTLKGCHLNSWDSTEKSDKLFGGLYKHEYNYAYRKEHAARMREKAKLQTPDFRGEKNAAEKQKQKGRSTKSKMFKNEDIDI